MTKKNTPKHDMRKDALAIFQAALAAAEPGRAVSSALERSGEMLSVLEGGKIIKSFDLSKVHRVFVIGAGKASAPMAKAVEDILGDRITDGLVCVKHGHGLGLGKIRVVEAGHPEPDQAGVEAALSMKDLLEETTKEDLVISVFSGGGSALLIMPLPGLKLADKQKVTRLMLACGADIREINSVRKHLSGVKGGRLARLAAPAAVVNLMLSDVIGDDMDVIASGPLVPDRSTFEEAAVVLAKYKLMKKIPAAAKRCLTRGLTGQEPETPKAGDPAFEQVVNVVIGSNLICLLAARDQAQSLGYRPLVLSSTIEGETREAARFHTALAREIQNSGNPVKAPACLISGGETTVTLKGPGKGGRNQEFALAAALALDGREKILVFSAGTDGSDGPTDAAGAMADGDTAARGGRAGLSARMHLEENNAYPFFEELGDLIKTGPTLTNVMDVRLVLVGK
ncbi:MAG: glycerate kinase [Pseudomonadota bacterium]